MVNASLPEKIASCFREPENFWRIETHRGLLYEFTVRRGKVETWQCEVSDRLLSTSCFLVGAPGDAVVALNASGCIRFEPLSYVQRTVCEGTWPYHDSHFVSRCMKFSSEEFAPIWEFLLFLYDTGMFDLPLLGKKVGVGYAEPYMVEVDSRRRVPIIRSGPVKLFDRPLLHRPGFSVMRPLSDVWKWNRLESGRELILGQISACADARVGRGPCDAVPAGYLPEKGMVLYPVRVPAEVERIYFYGPWDKHIELDTGYLGDAEPDRNMSVLISTTYL